MSFETVLNPATAPATLLADLKTQWLDFRAAAEFQRIERLLLVIAGLSGGGGGGGSSPDDQELTIWTDDSGAYFYRRAVRDAAGVTTYDTITVTGAAYVVGTNPRPAGTAPTISKTRQVSVTTSFVALASLAGRSVGVLNNTGADLDVRRAAETAAGQLITLKNGQSARFSVTANMSELEIRAAAGAAGVQLIIE